VRPEGRDRQAAVFSYFLGRPEAWRTGVPAFAKIVYEDLWPGIDPVHRGTVRYLKYEFVVRPGGDPAQIRLRYRGVTRAFVSAVGQAQASLAIPNDQDLVGIRIHSAFVTLAAPPPFGLHSISNTASFTITW